MDEEVERKEWCWKNAPLFEVLLDMVIKHLPSPLDETITLSDIYLNNNQRYALISQIKKSMASSIKSDGAQCVNGLKPTLLKQLELKRFRLKK